METKTFLMTTSFYPPFHIGGDAVYVRSLSEELTKLKHEVHVMFSLDAYSYKKPGFKGNLKEIEENTGVFLHPLKSYLGKFDLYLTYLFGRSPYVKKKFGTILKDIKPDVVHHHNIFFLGYDIMKKQRDYVNLYTAHDYWLICQRYDLMKYGHKECKKKSCLSCVLLSNRLPQVWRGSESFREAVRDVDTIIAPSNFMKKKLSEWLPLKTRIVHIPNFVPSITKNVKESGYSNYFLYVGVLEKHKGICNILKLFKENSGDLDAKLIIVGKGSLKEKIADYVTNNKLGERIIVLGWVGEEMLWSLYKGALAFVMPSIWPENNPLAALEAISLGTPVIGTNLGGIGEIIEKIDKSLIFKSDGVEELKMILNNKTISREKLKQVHMKWYSPEEHIKQYHKCLVGN